MVRFAFYIKNRKLLIGLDNVIYNCIVSMFANAVGITHTSLADLQAISYGFMAHLHVFKHNVTL
jgi:hypothetical protein